MRQIGVRDEARLLGLLGCCGRELCCCRFLQALKPVPMKVAKSQKSTLDPAKIGGRCGRLKCCLKYEDELYKELKKNLPRRGTNVETERGEGVVVGYGILSQTVTVRYEDDAEATLTLDEIAVPKRDSA
jgi:cell fate regulator YaaT (PSP1 superfamily)